MIGSRRYHSESPCWKVLLSNSISRMTGDPSTVPRLQNATLSNQWSGRAVANSERARRRMEEYSQAKARVISFWLLLRILQLLSSPQLLYSPVSGRVSITLPLFFSTHLWLAFLA